MSPLSRMLVRGDDPRGLCARLGGIFGAGNFYIDLQRHLDAGEERLNRKLAALAGAARIPHRRDQRRMPRRHRIANCSTC